MHLASAAAARPTYDSPTPARALGSRSSTRPYCCYSSAAARSAVVAHCSATGDGGAVWWGEGHDVTPRRGTGVVGEGDVTGHMDERPGNAWPRHDGQMSRVGFF